MSASGSDGGRRRFFRRRHEEEPAEATPSAPAGEPGAQGPDAGLFEEELSPEELEAQQRREEEAAQIQLARERAAAEAQRRERDEALARLMLWTDSHCHPQYLEGEEAETELVERAIEAGVRRMICVGTDVATSRQAIELSRRHSRTGALTVEVYATVGLHPHDAKAGTDELVELLEELKGSPDRDRVVAIGECGLDYHYDHSPRAVQRRVFAEQIRLANEHDLALVIHTREAFDDTFEILAAEGTPPRTVFHCFTGGPSEAERCLSLGAYLSFSGIVTFANAQEVREAARICPLHSLLVETDSPYLTPVPHRGRTNEPSYVRLVGEAIAKVKGVPVEQIASVTSENAVAVFRLDA